MSGARLDALIMRTSPDVRKALKWNSVAFFRGTSLRPLVPGESKHKGALLRHP